MTESSDETVGRVVGARGLLIRVELDEGEQLLVRSWRQLHRRFGYYVLPLNLRVKLSHRRKHGRRPLIIGVIKDR